MEPVVLVATTMAPWKVDGTHMRWLHSAMKWKETTNIKLFAALEVDARGLDPYRKLLHMATNVFEDFEAWEFSFKIPNETQYTSSNRLHRICAGRNLIHEYALRHPEITHVLFFDSDIYCGDEEAINKLLDLDVYLAGGVVPEYCLTEHMTAGTMHGGVEYVQRWNTAGFLLCKREVIKNLRWGHCPEDGLTDDPWFQQRAVELGYEETYIRLDVIASTDPLVPVEMRLVDRSMQHNDVEL